MTNAVEFKGVSQAYTGRTEGIEKAIEKSAPQAAQAQGQLLGRAEQLLARSQSVQARNLDSLDEINTLSTGSMALGNQIRNGYQPSERYMDALRSQGVLSAGIVTMAAVMLLMQEHSNALFESMQTRTAASRDAQEMANRVKTVLATLSKPEDKAELPQDVIDYMRENKILVDGKTIDEFLPNGPVAFPTAFPGSKEWPDAFKAYQEALKNPPKTTIMDQGSLKAVELALEGASGRASDFVQQCQLKLQQLVQTYNNATQMTNSLQSMLSESIKSISSSMR